MKIYIDSILRLGTLQLKALNNPQHSVKIAIEFLPEKCLLFSFFIWKKNCCKFYGLIYFQRSNTHHCIVGIRRPGRHLYSVESFLKGTVDVISSDPVIAWSIYNLFLNIIKWIILYFFFTSCYLAFNRRNYYFQARTMMILLHYEPAGD